jgi:uncharacterized protein YicC (UPF0701 family)
MVLSMTGYASHELSTSSGVLLIELRSVNHRYLELQLKIEDCSGKIGTWQSRLSHQP